MTVIIGNPARGCGHKKQGGCYAESIGGPGGTLVNTWCFGSHIEGRENFYVEVPPRGMQLFNPSASFAAGDLVPWGRAVDEADELELARKVGITGLIDHVGANNYTPFSFAMEAFAHGISRRIPPALARQIAPLCPIPIFFVAKLPIFPDEDTARGIHRAVHDDLERDGDFDATPSWRDPRWSMHCRPYQPEVYQGEGHYMVPVTEHWSKYGRAFDDPTQQTVFFAGWICRVSYVLKPNETDLPDELKNTGVVPGILEDDPRSAQLYPEPELA